MSPMAGVLCDPIIFLLFFCAIISILGTVLHLLFCSCGECARIERPAEVRSDIQHLIFDYLLPLFIPRHNRIQDMDAEKDRNAMIEESLETKVRLSCFVGKALKVSHCSTTKIHRSSTTFVLFVCCGIVTPIHLTSRRSFSILIPCPCR